MTDSIQGSKGCDLIALATALYKKQCDYVGADHKTYSIEETVKVLDSFEDKIMLLEAELDKHRELLKKEMRKYADARMRGVYLEEVLTSAGTLLTRMISRKRLKRRSLMFVSSSTCILKSDGKMSSAALINFTAIFKLSL